MKDKIFCVLQSVFLSFMLPIALLPIAGLLLGIGSSFTNPTTLSAYNLDGVITDGGVLFTIFDLMKKTGSIVFDNLALLFFFFFSADKRLVICLAAVGGKKNFLRRTVQYLCHLLPCAKQSCCTALT